VDGKSTSSARCMNQKSVTNSESALRKSHYGFCYRSAEAGYGDLLALCQILHNNSHLHRLEKQCAFPFCIIFMQVSSIQSDFSFVIY
jgi:hypothetical protein